MVSIVNLLAASGSERFAAFVADEFPGARIREMTVTVIDERSPVWEHLVAFFAANAFARVVRKHVPKNLKH